MSRPNIIGGRTPKGLDLRLANSQLVTMSKMISLTPLKILGGWPKPSRSRLRTGSKGCPSTCSKGISSNSLLDSVEELQWLRCKKIKIIKHEKDNRILIFNAHFSCFITLYETAFKTASPAIKLSYSIYFCLIWFIFISAWIWIIKTKFVNVVQCEARITTILVMTQISCQYINYVIFE